MFNVIINFITKRITYEFSMILFISLINIFLKNSMLFNSIIIINYI